MKKQMERLGTIAQEKKLIAAFRERHLPVIFMSVIPNPINYLPKWGFIFEMTGKVDPKGLLNNPKTAELGEVIPEMGRLPASRCSITPDTARSPATTSWNT